MSTLGLAVTVALLLSGQSSPAAAKKLSEAAAIDFKSGSFDKAIEEFTEAYHLDPVPKTLFNLGQCHRELGHWKQAIFFFKNYLHDEQDPPNRPTVERLIAEAETQMKTGEGSAPPPATAPPTVASAPPPAPVIVEAPSASAPVVVEAPAPSYTNEVPPAAPPSYAPAPTPGPAPAPATSVAWTPPPRQSPSYGAVLGFGIPALFVLAGATTCQVLSVATLSGDKPTPVTVNNTTYSVHTISASQYSTGYTENLAADVLWGLGGALVIATIIAIATQ